MFKLVLPLDGEEVAEGLVLMGTLDVREGVELQKFSGLRKLGSAVREVVFQNLHISSQKCLVSFVRIAGVHRPQTEVDLEVERELLHTDTLLGWQQSLKQLEEVLPFSSVNHLI